MKRIIAIILALALLLSMTACGKKTETTTTQAADTAAEATAEPAAEAEPTEAPAELTGADDAIDDAAWDAMAELGGIETENGVLFATVTLPSGFTGEDVTQESLDANAGETYTSATLNEDGSITYKLTKKQHKEMMDSITEAIDESINGLVEGGEYAFTKIEHNADFTVFNVYLNTDEVGMSESFMALMFYLYGGVYAGITGKDVDNITVNYYGTDGTLLDTANSSSMGE